MTMFALLLLLGHDARTEPFEIRRRMSIITHGSHLYHDLTARQNLELVAELIGAESPNIDGLLERVGLASQSERAVAQFSAGMKRRVVIARMMRLCVQVTWHTDRCKRPPPSPSG